MAEGIRRTSQKLLRRSAALRDDVRESTDANLLASLRVLGLLYGPIDRHARIDRAFQKSRAYRLAPQIGWRQIRRSSGRVTPPRAASLPV